MSMKYLGETLDIHGGGLDLQFPHHENELAQSESATGRPFARYWMHNGLLKMGNSKMAGSVGNVVNIVDLLREHEAETVRFFLLSTHYRRPIDYNPERDPHPLVEIRRGLDGFYRFFERFQRVTGSGFYQLAAPARRAPFDLAGAHKEFLAEVARQREAFLEHMDDDFNTGGAIGVLYELLNTLNRFADARRLEGGQPDPAAARDFTRGVVALKELSQILGVFHEPARREDAGGDRLVAGLVQLFIDLRAEARRDKNFALGDQIRDRLKRLGVTLEDRAGGTTWRLG
jgi:cysteinyl-tRNA synthetase